MQTYPMMDHTTASNGRRRPGPEDAVVEIALLLPTERASELVDLASRRQQSVGQLLRGLIDRELAGDC